MLESSRDLELERANWLLAVIDTRGFYFITLHVHPVPALSNKDCTCNPLQGPCCLPESANALFYAFFSIGAAGGSNSVVGARSTCGRRSGHRSKRDQVCSWHGLAVSEFEGQLCQQVALPHERLLLCVQDHSCLQIQ